MEAKPVVCGLEENDVSADKSSKPFLDSGECPDEVTLLFDDGKKLYVSESLLCYASPVFKAMFQHDFEEKRTREVSLKEKSFDDFLEFLLCLHPGVQKPINNDNVLQVVSLAEEYQVSVSVAKCQEVMVDWLTAEVKSASPNNHVMAVKTCLTILTTAVACNHDDVITHAVAMIAAFGYNTFTGACNIELVQTRPLLQAPVFGFGFPTSQSHSGVLHVRLQGAQASSVNEDSPLTDCKKLYENLPNELKFRLLLKRLQYCDDGKMHLC